ncbi:unnamed protein product [Dibothriocephalus latus]|uniref:Uncharacterized protein n=1 Tax=Dibothriocephalus latus TaxID=60516 RepID=A0A3P6TE39_DIBLA|nr:unnamed protein product [Dibothriocephalus latus]
MSVIAAAIHTAVFAYSRFLCELPTEDVVDALGDYKPSETPKDENEKVLETAGSPDQKELDFAFDNEETEVHISTPRRRAQVEAAKAAAAGNVSIPWVCVCFF